MLIPRGTGSGPNARQPRGQRRRPPVVEPHPVDDGLVCAHPEQPRPGVARLDVPGHSADLDEPEAQQRPGPQGARPSLSSPPATPTRVGKRSPMTSMPDVVPDPGYGPADPLSQRPQLQSPRRQGEPTDRHAVRALGVHPEQHRPHEPAVDPRPSHGAARCGPTGRSNPPGRAPRDRVGRLLLPPGPPARALSTRSLSTAPTDRSHTSDWPTRLPKGLRILSAGPTSGLCARRAHPHTGRTGRCAMHTGRKAEQRK